MRGLLDLFSPQPIGSGLLGQAADHRQSPYGLPQAVLNSMMYAPSYGEGERMPLPDNQVNALNAEAGVRPDRDLHLSDAVDQAFRRLLGLPPEQSAWGKSGPYQGPLEPGMSRFPLALY